MAHLSHDIKIERQLREALQGTPGTFQRSLTFLSLAFSPRRDDAACDGPGRDE